MLGDYFETRLLLRFLSSDELPWTALRSLDELGSAPDPAVVFVEPVRYGWDLATVNMTSLADRLCSLAAPPAVVVVDTTLSSPLWPRGQLLGALAAQADPPVVVEVRSGLKLDQQGLEVANVGMLLVHAVVESQTNSIAETVRVLRGTLGYALERSAQRALDPPFIFDRRMTRAHSGQIFANNRNLAFEISRASNGRVFSDVVHPALNNGGHAPFVILRVPNDSPELVRGIKMRLLEILSSDLQRGRLNLGSSFGFRHSRFETIKPINSEERMFLKVAMGSRTGPSAVRLGDALSGIAAE